MYIYIAAKESLERMKYQVTRFQTWYSRISLRNIKLVHHIQRDLNIFSEDKL